MAPTPADEPPADATATPTDAAPADKPPGDETLGDGGEEPEGEEKKELTPEEKEEKEKRKKRFKENEARRLAGEGDDWLAKNAKPGIRAKPKPKGKPLSKQEQEAAARLALVPNHPMFNDHPMSVAFRMGCFSRAFRELQQLKKDGANLFLYGLSGYDLERIIRIGKMHLGGVYLMEQMISFPADLCDYRTAHGYTQTGAEYFFCFDKRRNTTSGSIRFADCGVDPLLVVAYNMEADIKAKWLNSAHARGAVPKNTAYQVCESVGKKQPDFDRLICYREIQRSKKGGGLNFQVYNSVVDLFDDPYKVTGLGQGKQGLMLLHYTIPPGVGYKPDLATGLPNEDFLADTMGDVSGDCTNIMHHLKQRAHNMIGERNMVLLEQPDFAAREKRAGFDYRSIFLCPLSNGNCSVQVAWGCALDPFASALMRAMPAETFKKVAKVNPALRMGNLQELEIMTSSLMRERVLESERSPFYEHLRKRIDGYLTGKNSAGRWQDSGEM